MYAKNLQCNRYKYTKAISNGGIIVKELQRWAGIRFCLLVIVEGILIPFKLITSYILPAHVTPVAFYIYILAGCNALQIQCQTEDIG